MQAAHYGVKPRLDVMSGLQPFNPSFQFIHKRAAL